MELIEIVLWIITSIFCFGFSIMFFTQFKKSERISKSFYLGLGIFMLCYGIARILEVIRRSIIASSYNDIVDAWINNTPIEGINLYLRILFYLLVWGGIAIQYYYFEHSIFKKNKHILTICSIVETIFVIINLISFNFVIYVILFILAIPTCLFMPILFLIMAKKMPASKTRKGCIFLAMGIILFVIGVMIILPEFTLSFVVLNINDFEIIFRMIAPIVTIFGAILIALGSYYYIP